MQLILMRHGKAEARGSRLNDEERELTEQGRRRVQAAAKGLRRHLPSGSRVYLWASPLARAWQTAEIIGQELGLVPEPKPSIANGSLSALSCEWGSLEEEAIVMVVGHEPHLSRWLAYVTDAVVPFKPAAAVGIKLGQDGFMTGKLRWFATAGALAEK